MEPLHKAAQLNQDPGIYGTIAEIGAGQEIVRYFFRAGLSSQTIAKSMSAYDMVFSDAIYGLSQEQRYVCKSRLVSMLDHEYELLQSRLGAKRPIPTRYFALADTVAVRSKKRGGQAHGWIGIRFQSEPGAKFSDIILHIRLLGEKVLTQHDILGKLGVNLIYAAFFHAGAIETLIESLLDEIPKSMLEIDYLHCAGNDFNKPVHTDIATNYHLVRRGISKGFMVSPDGKVFPPGETLFNRPIFSMRGRFFPFSHLHKELLDFGFAEFKRHFAIQDEDMPIIIVELTMPKLKRFADRFLCEHHKHNSGDAGHQQGSSAAEEIDIANDHYLPLLSAQIEILTSMGYRVLFNNFTGYDNIIEFYRRYTSEPIGLGIGAKNFISIFREDSDSLLVKLGKIFQHNASMFVFPKSKTQEEAASNSVSKTMLESRISKKDHHIIEYLKASQAVIYLDQINSKWLDVDAHQINEMIQKQNDNWRRYVPVQAASRIESFYQCCLNK